MALDQPDARHPLWPRSTSCRRYHVLTNVTLGWGLEIYHWFFMAQKAPFPEKLICADLDYYIRYKLNKKGVGLEIFTPEALAEYARCTTPEQIHAVCEDYRATVTLDLAMDTADFGKSKIACPVLVLWGSNSHCRPAFQAAGSLDDLGDDLRGWRFRPGIIRPSIGPTLSTRASDRSSTASSRSPTSKRQA